MSSDRVGQRRSLKGDICTIRFEGQVSGKNGSWLGVEWDDPTRGKHNGTFEEHVYFTCRSSSPTCASFLRADVKFDYIQTLKEAVKTKYASVEDPTAGITVQISGKTVEETGYDKIASRQRQLASLKVVVLDHQCLNRVATSIKELCPSVVTLDLGYNTFMSLDDALPALQQLNDLRSLSLEYSIPLLPQITAPNSCRGNRFSVSSSMISNISLPSITRLDLSATLLRSRDLAHVLQCFPKLEHLTAGANDLASYITGTLPSTLQSLELHENIITNLADLAAAFPLDSKLQSLSLKGNAISGDSSRSSSSSPFPSTIEEVDLSSNDISTWSFIDSLSSQFPGLKHLRLSNNPIYSSSTQSHQVTSMLVTARLPQLITLNYTTIRPVDRLNAETFYLASIATELSAARADQEQSILVAHPRWTALCEEYGAPAFSRAEDARPAYPANSIAARLITVDVHFVPAQNSTSPPAGSSSAQSPVSPDIPRATLRIPQSQSVYTLYALVARTAEIQVTHLSLVWETGERDPPDKGMGVGSGPIEEWDSEEDEAAEARQRGGGDHADAEEARKADWVPRELRLVPGTRPVGTVFEGRHAVLRAEIAVASQDR